MSETNDYLKVNNNTLTKQEQQALLRAVLPACNAQEGSPANTFTQSELHDLQVAVGNVHIGPSKSITTTKTKTTTTTTTNNNNNNKIDIRDLQSTFQPQQPPPQQPFSESLISAACPQDGEEEEIKNKPIEVMDWHGAPKLHKDCHLPRAFREEVRRGKFTTATNGVCPGFLQCNLVVLPQGPIAFDFLLFCQRNPRACPLIEVCDVGSPFPHGVAPGADLRTDVPK
jgi:hypothetical protein